jgi:FkbM family methyltransferase
MSIAVKIAKSLKPIIPAGMWSSSKNFYNRSRYALLWRNRRVVNFRDRGTPISLVIVDPADHIQKVQAGGSFYEQGDLETLTPYFREGGTFVDIGANTGQHSIYFAKVLGAKAIILLEPIRETCNILIENLRLNDLLDTSDISCLGLGLSDKASHASFDVNPANLGATILHESSSGPIPTETGDAVLRDQYVDFIKIDTEGFEIKVLHGLSDTIRRCRPTIYVEVADENGEAFLDFVSQTRYRIELRHRNYGSNENFLILPGEGK